MDLIHRLQRWLETFQRARDALILHFPGFLEREVECSPPPCFSDPVFELYMDFLTELFYPT